jgi:hypothetical protein
MTTKNSGIRNEGIGRYVRLVPGSEKEGESQ